MKSNSLRVRGCPVSWIGIYAAIIGIAALVPLIPYMGGGGFLPLCIPIVVIAPLILGIWPGVIAAFVGSVLGMFISPSAFPMGFFDVIVVGTLPALFAGFVFNGDKVKYWASFTLIYLVNAAFAEIVPFYFPGKSAGFAPPPQPTYFLVVAIFWAPALITYISIGQFIPKWSSAENRKKRYIITYIGQFIAILCWGMPYWYLYAYVLKLTPEVVTAGYLLWQSWVMPLIAFVATVIVIPLAEVLRKSSFSPPSEALWKEQLTEKIIK